MDKRIDFLYGDNNSEVLTLFHPTTFEKTAGISEEILSFIKTLKAKPGFTYALLNALSAGEYYGSNRNGDYFPETSLKEYHKTFEAMANVFKHHVNKDPNISLGKVSYSHYNPKMHRVELIVELNNDKAKDIIERLNAGELPAVSMGCRVPYDVCSVCGNKAANRTQYCDHLKTQMNKILPGGQKVYAINTMPKFFDISIVTIPADQTAGFLKVISELNNENNRATYIKLASFENNSYIKTAGLQNTAALNKEVEGTISAADSDPKELLKKVKHRMNKETIEKLAQFPLNETLSTFLSLGIVPSKEDFQKLALYNTGHRALADELDEEHRIFADSDPVIPNDVSPELANEKIANLLVEEIPYFSNLKPFVVTRGLLKVAAEQVENTYGAQPPAERSMLKRLLFSSEPEPQLSPLQNPLIPLGIAGGLYAGYLKLMDNPLPKGLGPFLKKHPWLIPLLIGAGTGGSLLAQQAAFDKNAELQTRPGNILANSLITLPITYYLAGKAENSAQKGEPITGLENFVRKHPALSGVIAAIGSAKLQGMLKIGSLVLQMPEPVLDEVYQDLLELN